MNENQIRAPLISQSDLIGDSVDQLLYYGLNTSRTVESKIFGKALSNFKNPQKWIIHGLH